MGHRARQMTTGTIRIGVGGWTYEPWCGGTFYPKGLAHNRELHHASRQLSAIEINGTYYSTQKRESFAKWRDETPDDFVFSVKASRFATNRRVLSGASESIERFVDSGLDELRTKLGPIVWQFATTKRFDPDDFEAFLLLLPTTLGGRPLRHAMDVRHDSFKVPAYLALARKYRVATVFTDSDDYPSFADITGDFFYARLMRTREGIATGCEPAALDAMADCARVWAAGGEPAALPRVEPRPSSSVASAGSPTSARDVFLFFISGAKQRAPAAAQALIERLA